MNSENANNSDTSETVTHKVQHTKRSSLLKKIGSSLLAITFGGFLLLILLQSRIQTNQTNEIVVLILSAITCIGFALLSIGRLDDPEYKLQKEIRRKERSARRSEMRKQELQIRLKRSIKMLNMIDQDIIKYHTSENHLEVKEMIIRSSLKSRNELVAILSEKEEQFKELDISLDELISEKNISHIIKEYS